MSYIVTSLLGRSVEWTASNGIKVHGKIVGISLEDGIFYYTIELATGKLVNRNYDSFVLLTVIQEIQNKL